MLLPNPNGVQSGNGSQVHYVECPPDKPIPAAAFRQWLLACLHLPEMRSEKLALV